MAGTSVDVRWSGEGIWFYRVVRWSLALVFLYAGILKLLEPQSFAVIIAAYGLIPEALVLPVAVLLPALEVIAALGLLFDLRGSLATIAILLAIFILILGYGIWMGLDIDCGCFGPEDPEGQAYAGMRPAVYRDFILAGCVLVLYGWRIHFGLKPEHIPWGAFSSTKIKEPKNDDGVSIGSRNDARNRDAGRRMGNRCRQGQV